MEFRVDLLSRFRIGGFHLRKWKSSEQNVLCIIPSDLVDPKMVQKVKYEDVYTFTKVLG